MFELDPDAEIQSERVFFNSNSYLYLCYVFIANVFEIKFFPIPFPLKILTYEFRTKIILIVTCIYMTGRGGGGVAPPPLRHMVGEVRSKMIVILCINI